MDRVPDQGGIIGEWTTLARSVWGLPNNRKSGHKQFGKMMVITTLQNGLALARSPNWQFERCLVHDNGMRGAVTDINSRATASPRLF